ncbi:MAG: tRNA (5-methylaminomethyl-2-thiouridine)(34)-methyltransferase MnmD [Cyclobacteriaceae bacterium]
MEQIRIITTDDGSHSLYREDLKETYHSFHGALQESVHVFINKGLDYYYDKYQPSEISILEVGFGTGLNALLTQDFAERHQVHILFETLETIPLEAEVYQNLNYAEKMDKEEIFLAMHDCPWGSEEKISPYFSLKKIQQPLEGFRTDRSYDVIYFDAFAPSKQPELWEKNIMEQVYGMTANPGVFTTYCAKGQLKRDLKEVGYAVSTLPGAPGKKEMVRAEKTS